VIPITIAVLASNSCFRETFLSVAFFFGVNVAAILDTASLQG
jgi:hypothetical protein